MPAVKAKNLQRMLEDKTKGPAFVERFLSESLESGHLAAEDFSIRDIFVSVVPDGREMVEYFNPNQKRGGFSSNREMMEAADAVSSSHFANITGQLIYSQIMRQARAEDYVFSRIIPDVPTVFNGEKIPGVTNLADEAQVVNEGQEYPLAGFNEDWIETPQTLKRGNIVPVTKEAVFFDRTSLVLSTAGQVGLRLGANKEKRLIDAFLDVADAKGNFPHRHNWRGTTYASYSSTTPWVNLIGSNALVDWNSVNAVEQLAADIVDPNTGEPMPWSLSEIVVAPGLAATAFRVMNATSTSTKVGGYNASATVNDFDAPSPLARHEYSSPYAIVSSRMLKQRMTAGSVVTTNFYLTRLSEAIEYRQNWPITVEQAGMDSYKAFERDIVAQYKASERGAAFVKQPRYLFQSRVGAL